MKTVFGVVNWRTLFTNIGIGIFAALGALAEAPAELGDLSQYIPAPYKAKVFLVSAGAAFLIRIINGFVAKDAHVTGDPPKPVQNP